MLTLDQATLLERINAALAPGRELRLAVGIAREFVGDAYLVDRDNKVIARFVDLDAFAKQLGIVAPDAPDAA